MTLVGYWLSTVALTLCGAVVAGISLYLLVLAIASFAYRGGRIEIAARSRLIVLVPAHDEEELIGRCVDSLRAQSYPAELYRIVVVADNCSDSTASVAKGHGADVLVRDDPDARGKGRALRWAMDLLLRDGDTLADALVVVDADSVADSDLLSQLAAAFEAGAEVVQADYEVLRDDSSPRSELAAAAFLLFHRVRFSGRASLRLPANLVGNGMLFGRSTLERHPWNSFSAVEDLELSLNLRVAGIRPAYAGGAVVYGPLPTATGATEQRVRWEGGRWTLARTRLPSLLIAILRGRLDLIDAALDLAVPPLGLLVVVCGGGLSISIAASSFGASSPWSLTPWVLAVACVPAFVVIGLRSAGAPPAAYRALLSAPRFLVWKMLAYARILRGFDPQRWEQPAIKPPQRGQSGGTFEVANVRIDEVDVEGAVARIEHALDGHDLFQVSTVNLDFLVRAQQSPDVRAVFQRSSLNVADGAPVVWLGRLLGNYVPERVAGADLVPLLMSRAAARGARVFLLGGENGVSLEAARRLERTVPGLQIAGCHEPPRASIDEMDSEDMLERIAQSGADIVLVALGHPKQELWIDRYRDRLTCKVAIGVGCVFDLIAGRQRRAPAWMQRFGLEWLHRVLQEPRRLLGRYATDSRWLMLITLRIFWQRLRVRTV